MRAFRNLLAGRWQFPAAVAAVACAAFAAHRLRPAPRPFDFDAALDNLVALREAGRVVDATNGAANLLEVETARLSDAQRAALDAFLVESIYRLERDNPAPRPANARLLILHEQQAAARGAAPDPARTRIAALAYEWLGEPLEAVAKWQELLQGDPGAPLRIEALEATARLLDGESARAAEREAALSAILADDAAQDGVASWAMTQAVRDAVHGGDVWRLRDLLTRYGDRFRRAPLRGFGAYLDGVLALAEDRPMVAETQARFVEAWLAQRAEAAEAGVEQSLGGLLAANHALAADALLSLGRAADAAERFEQALRFESSPSELARLRMRLARALAVIGRPVSELERALHGDAVEGSPGTPIERIDAAELMRLCDAIRSTGFGMSDTGRYDEARDYFNLLLRLVPDADATAVLTALESAARVAAAAADAVEALSDQRRLAIEAGRLYERAAGVADLDDARVTADLWFAADEYQRAGAADDYIRVLERFVEGRRYDPRFPKALWRLAQAHELRHELDRAIQRYGEVIEGFPNLPEAVLARVATARCVADRDPRDLPQAVAALEVLLDDGQTAPESLAFRDALRTLGALLHAAGDFPGAIARLEDMRAYFPGDEERIYTEFLLADAYRRNGLELREKADGAAWRERLRAAVARYGELLAESPSEVERAGGAGAAYRRMAMLYRGDCLMELNDPDSLNDALATFQQAALAYEGQPAALIAHVRIASIYLRLGRMLEAARVLERACWLLGNTPDGAFAAGLDGFGVRNWREYLSLIRESPLFRAAPEAN